MENEIKLSKDFYDRLISIVKRAANNSCCLCCDRCLSCDASYIVGEIGMNEVKHNDK